MKQTTVAVTAIAALLTGALGLSEAHAAALASDFANRNVPANLSVKQQKAIFAFSHEQVASAVALIERWSAAAPRDREELAMKFAESLFAAIKDRPDANAIMSDFGPSLLIADVLGNAQHVMATKIGGYSTEALSQIVAEVKAGLMRYCYEAREMVIVPYVPKKMAWGQHGQHRVRKPPRKPPSDQR